MSWVFSASNSRCRLPCTTVSNASVSAQIFSTSLRAAPGATKRNAPPSMRSSGSRRRARRKPSTATMVSPVSLISNSAPVWMGRASLVDTAKLVWLIMAFMVFCWMDTENSSSTVGSSG